MPARRLPTESPRLHGGAVPLSLLRPMLREFPLPFARADGMPLSPFAFAAARA